MPYLMIPVDENCFHFYAYPAIYLDFSAFGYNSDININLLDINTVTRNDSQLQNILLIFADHIL